MPEAEFVLQHGWAFSSQHWDSWRQDNQTHTLLRTPDRGYFNTGEAISNFQTDAACRVVVTHSLGLHLCAPTLFKDCSLLVIISGFQNFHALHNHKKVLSRMKRRLLTTPEGVVKSFHTNCYGTTGDGIATTIMPWSNLNKEALLADLELLDNSLLSLSPLHSIPHILLLHGQDDNVVSPEHSKRLQAALPNASLLICPPAGHALPFTHTSWCRQAIYATLKSLYPATEVNLTVPNRA